MGRGRDRSRAGDTECGMPFYMVPQTPKYLIPINGSTVGKPYNGIQGIGSVHKCIMGTYKGIKLSLKKVEEKINWKTLSESGKRQSKFHIKSILSRAISKLAL